jgi:hypothetical protein
LAENNRDDKTDNELLSHTSISFLINSRLLSRWNDPKRQPNPRRGNALWNIRDAFGLCFFSKPQHSRFSGIEFLDFP